mmetsp:Transcript_17013/g.59526  ORF Transcript_17013/g.59526 Transcript_17013/m.59526 type:complete len:323 (-) Transcript_17013:25-993(-)
MWIKALLQAMHSARPQLALKFRTDLRLSLLAVNIPSPSLRSTFSVPTAQKGDCPKHNKQRVEAQIWVVVHRVTRDSHVAKADKARDGRGSQPTRERVHPFKIHGNIGAEVPLDGIRRGKHCKLCGIPDGAPRRSIATPIGLVQWHHSLKHPRDRQGGYEAARHGARRFARHLQRLQLPPVHGHPVEQRAQQLRSLAGLPEVRRAVAVVAAVPLLGSSMKLNLAQALALHMRSQQFVCFQVAEPLCFAFHLVQPCRHHEEGCPVVLSRRAAIDVDVEAAACKDLADQAHSASIGVLGKSEQVAGPNELFDFRHASRDGLSDPR